MKTEYIIALAAIVVLLSAHVKSFRDSVLWFVISEIFIRSFQLVGIVAITIWGARKHIAEIMLFVGLLILIFLTL